MNDDQYKKIIKDIEELTNLVKEQGETLKKQESREKRKFFYSTFKKIIIIGFMIAILLFSYNLYRKNIDKIEKAIDKVVELKDGVSLIINSVNKTSNAIQDFGEKATLFDF